MKKILLTLVLISGLVLLSGCTGGDDNGDSGNGGADSKVLPKGNAVWIYGALPEFSEDINYYNDRAPENEKIKYLFIYYGEMIEDYSFNKSVAYVEPSFCKYYKDKVPGAKVIMMFASKNFVGVSDDIIEKVAVDIEAIMEGSERSCDGVHINFEPDSEETVTLMKKLRERLDPDALITTTAAGYVHGQPISDGLLSDMFDNSDLLVLMNYDIIKVCNPGDCEEGRECRHNHCVPEGSEGSGSDIAFNEFKTISDSLSQRFIEMAEKRNKYVMIGIPATATMHEYGWIVPDSSITDGYEELVKYNDISYASQNEDSILMWIRMKEYLDYSLNNAEKVAQEKQSNYYRGVSFWALLDYPDAHNIAGKDYRIYPYYWEFLKYLVDYDAGCGWAKSVVSWEQTNVTLNSNSYYETDLGHSLEQTINHPFITDDGEIIYPYQYTEDQGPVWLGVGGSVTYDMGTDVSNCENIVIYELTGRLRGWEVPVTGGKFGSTSAGEIYDVFVDGRTVTVKLRSSTAPGSGNIFGARLNAKIETSDEGIGVLLSEYTASGIAAQPSNYGYNGQGSIIKKLQEEGIDVIVYVEAESIDDYGNLVGNELIDYLHSIDYYGEIRNAADIEDLTKVKVMIFNENYNLRSSVITAIDEYVQNGGSLITLDAVNGVFRTDSSKWSEILGISDLYWSFFNEETSITTNTAHQIIEGLEIGVSYSEERAGNYFSGENTRGQIIANLNENMGIKISDYGKGKTVHFNWHFVNDWDKEFGSTTGRQIFLNALEWALE